MKANIKSMLNLVATGLLLFVVGVMVGRSITGQYTTTFTADTETLFTTIIIGAIALAILAIFIYINRTNILQLGKNLVSTLAILSGLYVLFKYVRDVELISSLLALTFGVWAIIWTITAHSVLSKGSTIRKYVGNFFMCLIFVLVYSLWDMATGIFNLQGWIIYMKYIIIILVYTTFVFSAYKIYRIGKEFGFAEESSRIKRVLSLRKKKE